MSGGGDAIVVLNAGSSSIKFCTFLCSGGLLERELRGQVSGIGTAPRLGAERGAGVVADRKLADANASHADALEVLLDFLRAELHGETIIGVGHRVVHGGLEFMAPTCVDADTLERLRRYVPLAPLHQPHNLAPIRAIAAAAPDLAQVACFDTAFHRSQPALAQAFALPASITERGVRRYGFHGLSYEYVAHALPKVDARAARGRVVVAHLGNGASMCAMQAGRSVASTMGFTAVDGLVMGTRSGALDPGVILYLIDELRMDARAIERLLYRESGLLGVSGVSSDMRTLLASDAPGAKLAVDLFCYRAGRELGSLAAALGGLDALVFTGGIGENAAGVRARIVDGGTWLGLELDPAANARNAQRITTPDSDVPAYVVPTDEELTIARHTLALVEK
jgi:acetate kinase